MPTINVNIRRLAAVIANTVDLVGVDDIAHGKRVAVMARECARLKGLDAKTQERLFQAGLLHDCGVSSTRVHRTLVTELDWEGAKAHCELGCEILGRFQPLAHLAPLVLHHHTHWKDLLEDGVEAETASHANLIYLADRADMLAAQYQGKSPPLFHAAAIRERLARYAGNFFSPEWMEVFAEASAQEAFWLRQTPESIAQQMLETPWVENGVLDLAQLHAFASIIAHIVDAKSPFTAEHSLGVARLSSYLGGLAGFEALHRERVEIAGLLHDIGKLQIPDEILEKPAKLDANEWAAMRGHSFMTWQILSPIEGLEQIAQWAAHHHESINGAGYPFHLHGDEISMEARIIRIADVYQAMAQNRPYRRTTPPEDILALLHRMVTAGEIDGDVVALVEKNLQDFHAVALGLPAPAGKPGT